MVAWRFIVARPTRIGVARRHTHGERKTVQHVAPTRSADGRLTSHARVYRLLDSLPPCRAASTHTGHCKTAVVTPRLLRGLAACRDSCDVRDLDATGRGPAAARTMHQITRMMRERTECLSGARSDVIAW